MIPFRARRSVRGGKQARKPESEVQPQPVSASRESRSLPPLEAQRRSVLAPRSGAPSLEPAGSCRRESDPDARLNSLAVRVRRTTAVRVRLQKARTLRSLDQPL